MTDKAILEADKRCKECGCPNGLMQELAAHRAMINRLEEDINNWTDNQFYSRDHMDFRDFKRAIHFRFADARKMIADAYCGEAAQSSNCIRLNIIINESVPDNEVHIHAGGKVIGKIINLDTTTTEKT